MQVHPLVMYIPHLTLCVGGAGLPAWNVDVHGAPWEGAANTHTVEWWPLLLPLITQPLSHLLSLFLASFLLMYLPLPLSPLFLLLPLSSLFLSLPSFPVPVSPLPSSSTQSLSPIFSFSPLFPPFYHPSPLPFPNLATIDPTGQGSWWLSRCLPICLL